MPLRDHFRPPLSQLGSGEGFHALWPSLMVLQLSAKLPARFVAEPRVRLGTYFEIDIGTLDREDGEELTFNHASGDDDDGGVAVAPAIQTAIAPTITLDAEFPDEYAYEVLIFDLEQRRRLVAAIEIASPAYKDRPESRRLFVAKCFRLMRADICVSIVDLVTNRNFNLYTELLALVNRSDPSLGPEPPSTYAVTCFKREEGKVGKLDVWSKPLVVGEPLPQLPIWLPGPLNIAVDLEGTYEDTCRVLRLVK